MTFVNIYSPKTDGPEFLLRVFGEIDEVDNPILMVGGYFNPVIGPLDYQRTKLQHFYEKTSEIQ